MKKYLSAGLFVGLLVIAFSFAAQAQDDDRAMPIVAVVKADWCTYCKRVEPVMMQLMKDYGEKLQFVVFDVTNDETSKAAMEKAEKLGLTQFFKEHKEKTSAVAVLKGKKVHFKTFNNNNREDYVKAFESALKQGH